jgi:hypothetical protein
VPTDEGKRTDGGTDRFARIAPEEASEILGSKVAIRLAGSSVSLAAKEFCSHGPVVHEACMTTRFVPHVRLPDRFGTTTKPILKLLLTWGIISIVSTTETIS